MTSPRPATSRAVILARGLGTRMRRNDDTHLTPEQMRAAEAGAKAMLPVGRPFLDYVLSALADAGITDVCIVVAPDDTALQRRYREELTLERVHVVFVYQREPQGTANALLAARGFAGDANVLVLNADNYYPVDVVRALRALGGAGVPGFDAKALVELGHIDAERVRAYALLQVDKDGFLTDIVEKPDATTFDRFHSAPVSMNLWSMPPAIFDACERVAPSARGELELPDAVRIAMQEYHVKFTVLPFALGVLDLSSRADVPAITARLQGTQVRL